MQAQQVQQSVLVATDRGPLRVDLTAVVHAGPPITDGHLEAVRAAAERLVSVMDGFYPRPVQDALTDLAVLIGHLSPPDEEEPE
jgi:hypothetical protein